MSVIINCIVIISHLQLGSQCVKKNVKQLWVGEEYQQLENSFHRVDQMENTRLFNVAHRLVSVGALIRMELRNRVLELVAHQVAG